MTRIFIRRALLSLLLLWMTSTTKTNAQLIINPWTTRPSNAPYELRYALVGDIIRFIWPDDEEHTVWIYPSGSCADQTDRIPVGGSSRAAYTFKEEDGSTEGNTLLFVCDVDNHCAEQGMRLRVTVYSTALPPFALPPPAPVAAPVDVSTPPPTVMPVSPVEAPVAPVEAPVAPTEAPVAPTDAPIAPTEAPVAPTEAPVTPTEAPVAPTEAPVVAPVAVPTIPPDTDTPTAAPTDFDETFAPTSPGTATIPPTTSSPTPLSSTKNVTLRGLNMEIFNINTFGSRTEQSWAQTTAQYSEAYTQEMLDGIVIGFSTSIKVTGSTIVLAPSEESGLRRKLQTGQDSVKITYSQTLIYDTTDTTLQLMDLATMPFDTEEKRDNYVTFLNQNSGNTALSQVTSSSAVTQSTPIAPTMPPMPGQPTQPPSDGGEPSSTLATAAIIGIACGGAAFLLLCAMVFVYCRIKPEQKDSRSSLTPPLNISAIKDDDVSTLHDPHVAGGRPNGDQSVATVDYDYSKAYGNGDTSVSSAGGTFGSHTQNQSVIDPAVASAIGAALGPFDDDGSFEAHYRAPGSNAKEEILHVFAPAGKLGVVIDTPDDGSPPLIHAVKENSVIYGRVKVGDKLVAVDDEDVRTMTAVKVSKLISRKSANPSRKLTIVRTTMID